MAGTSTYASNEYTISVAGDGYYFIKDKANSLPTDSDTNADHVGDAETRYILQVVGDVTVAAKSDTVKSEKKIDDINDSTGTTELLKDSADYDIGDHIPYTLTFTLPANYDAYTKYAVTFVDDMSAGLTYDGNATIHYGASDTTGAAISFTEATGSSYTGGKVYKASVADLKTTAPGLANGDVITIKYTATLNDNALVGATGNPNKYHVEYSNNPNGDGSGTTPDDINIAFTYDIEVDKVTGTGDDKTALTGAAFALYKKYATVPSGKTAATSIKYDNGTKDYTIVTGDNWVLVEQKTIGDSVFTFSGVDDGTYLLVETTTPSGYNSIEPSVFTITADHTLESDTPSLTGVTGTYVSGATIELGTKTKSASDSTVTGVKTEVINNSGATLPSTGGSGTTMIYIIGVILLAGAVILLVTKRRMNAE